MPNMNGVELFYAIQEIPVIKEYNIPIVLLTGSLTELPAFPSKEPAAIIGKAYFQREELLKLVKRLVTE
jgi:CheY-like chemotaxis protein